MNPGGALCPAYRKAGGRGRGRRNTQRGRGARQALWGMSRAVGSGEYSVAGCLHFPSFCAHFISWVQGLREFPLPSPLPQSLRAQARGSVLGPKRL